jgi:hypothetical protein
MTKCCQVVNYCHCRSWPKRLKAPPTDPVTLPIDRKLKQLDDSAHPLPPWQENCTVSREVSASSTRKRNSTQETHSAVET